jgi:hypothetical protein
MRHRVGRRYGGPAGIISGAASARYRGSRAIGDCAARTGLCNPGSTGQAPQTAGPTSAGQGGDEHRIERTRRVRERGTQEPTQECAG